MIRDYLEFAREHPALFDNEQAIIKLDLDPDRITAWRDKRIMELSEKKLPL